MSKYVGYDSDAWKSFLQNNPTAGRVNSFEEWAELNNVIINWGEDDYFLQFENNQSRLAFLLKWC
jgi:hypothetical protein